MTRAILVLLLAALGLSACGSDDGGGSAGTASTSSPAASSTSPSDQDHEHPSEGAEHEDHDPGHVDTACEAELAELQGDDGQVLSASVEPDLTCTDAVPVITAINALHPVGDAPATLSAEGFECTVEQDEPDGMQVEVFRCTDDRGTVVWARS